MGEFDWHDAFGLSSLNPAEIDRWQLDHGGYPGQFENAEPLDDDYESSRTRRNTRRSSYRSYGESSDNDVDDNDASDDEYYDDDYASDDYEDDDFFEDEEYYDDDLDDDSDEDDEPLNSADRLSYKDRKSADDDYNQRNDLDDYLQSIRDELNKLLSEIDDSDDSASYLDLTISKINQNDLDSAHRLKSHLDDTSHGTPTLEKTCYDCAFWRGEHASTTRAWGCHIYYAVSIEYGGSMPDIPPKNDSKVCDFFSDGIGDELTCFACNHWPQDEQDGNRSDCCAIWDKVCADNKKLHQTAREKFGPSVSFTEFETDSPATDCDICTNFTLRDGYTPAKKPLRIMTKVVGIGFENRSSIWENALSDAAANPTTDPTTDQENSAATDTANELSLVREPDNSHDANAIAVYVDGNHGGYLPKKDAATLAPLIDNGQHVAIANYKINKIERAYKDPYYYIALTIEIENQDSDGDSVAHTAKENTPADHTTACNTADSTATTGHTAAEAAKTMPADVYPAMPEVFDALEKSPDAAIKDLKNLKR